MRPLSLSARPQWRALDWVRYLCVKHSLDALLVCVVLLCTLQAAARAQRRRARATASDVAFDALVVAPNALGQPGSSRGGSGSGGNRSGSGGGGAVVSNIFWLLPAFNLGVLALELLYQAPVQLLLPGEGWDAPCRDEAEPPGPPSDAALSGACAAPQLLGLCKFRPAGGYGAGLSIVISLLHSPAIADLVLFALLRAYAKLLSSSVYRQVMTCVAETDRAVAAQLAQFRALNRDKAAQGALEEARLQSARDRRIARLKSAFVPNARGSLPARSQRASRIRAENLTLLSEGLVELLDSEVERNEAWEEQSRSWNDNVGGEEGEEAQVPQGVPPAAGGAAGVRKSHSTLNLFGRGAVAGAAAEAAAGVEARAAGLRRRGRGGASTASLGAAATAECNATDAGGGGSRGGGGWAPGDGLQQSLDARLVAAGVAKPPGGWREGSWRAAVLGRLAKWSARAGTRATPEDSAAAYFWLLALFLTDCSLLSLPAPLSLLLYALLSAHKGRAFWQGVLVYLEVLLILQYSFQIMVHCFCCGRGATCSPGFGSPLHSMLTAAPLEPYPGWGATGGLGAGFGGGIAVPPPPGYTFTCSGILSNPSVQAWLRLIGLHFSPLWAAPTFVAYLATLMHTYHLGQLATAAVPDAAAAAAAGSAQAAPQRIAPAPSAAAPTPAAPPAAAAAPTATSGAPASGPGSAFGSPIAPAPPLPLLPAPLPLPHGPPVVASAPAHAAVWDPEVWMRMGPLLWRYVCHSFSAMRDVYRTVTVPHEVAPHWVRVTLAFTPSTLFTPAAGPADPSASPQSTGGSSGTQPQPGMSEGAGQLPGSYPAAAPQLSDPQWWDGSEGRAALQACLQRTLAVARLHHSALAAMADELDAAAAADGGSFGVADGEGDASEGGDGDGVSLLQAPPPGCDTSVMPPLLLRLEHMQIDADGRGCSALLEVTVGGMNGVDGVNSVGGVDGGVAWLPRPARAAAAALASVAEAQSADPPAHTLAALPPPLPLLPPPPPPPAPSSSALSGMGGTGMTSGVDSGTGPLPRVWQPNPTFPQPQQVWQPNVAFVGLPPAPGAASLGHGAPEQGEGGQGAARVSGENGSDGDGGVQLPPALPSHALPFRLLGAQAYSAPAADFYTATVTLDFLTFVYMAVFYHSLWGSSTSSIDVASNRILPAHYIGTLIAYSVLMVAERAVYMLGSHPLKALLHTAGVCATLALSLALFWFPGAGAATHWHIRVLCALRLASSALSALQLRAGYPPLSRYGHAGGRHAMIFYSHPDQPHYVAFNIFNAVPFLFEMRMLLDWTCTATVLDWQEWLKLEDVRANLFVAAVRRRMRESRRLGQKVPAYVKFLQGVLLLALLLVVLWLPLLVFSSGAPTYQTPTVVDVSLNVTVAQYSASGSETAGDFLLYAAGGTRSVRDWLPPSDDGSLPIVPPGLRGYDRQQIKLMCLTQESRDVWALSPPMRASLSRLLESPDSVALKLGWSLQRSAPMATQHGGPGCEGVVSVALSDMSSAALLEVLSGARDSAIVTAVDPADPTGPGLPSLYPRFWRAGGESCVLLFGMEVPGGRGGNGGGRAGGRGAVSSGSDSGSDSGGGDGSGGGSGGGGGSASASASSSGSGGGSGSGSGSGRPGRALSALRTSPLAAVETAGTMGSSSGTTLGATGALDLSRHHRSPSPAPGPHPKPEPSPEPALMPPHKPDPGPSPDSPDPSPSPSPAPSPPPGPGPDQDPDAWAYEGIGCSLVLARAPTSSSPGGGDGDYADDDADAGLRARGGSGGARSGYGAGGGAAAWWEVRCGPLAGDGTPLAPDGGGGGGGGVDCGEGFRGPQAVVVLEKVQTGLLGATLSSFGITGLYLTFVYGVGRFLRLSMSNLALTIPFQDMPSTRRLVTLCQDLYIARAQGEFLLEEELYKVLISIYRSPSVLFELTRRTTKRA
ncbi:hypothetical protein FOA52_002531 [Chlamydomonas sp. UWO 241]|nr:hypothetical protein FOA52_002531 [Chlamydomonas sp. UWO 241]